GGHLLGDGLADAAGGAGDHRHLAGEVEERAREAAGSVHHVAHARAPQNGCLISGHLRCGPGKGQGEALVLTAAKSAPAPLRSASRRRTFPAHHSTRTLCARSTRAGWTTKTAT